MGFAVAALFLKDEAQARRLHGAAGAVTPLVATVIKPGTGWNGTEASGFTSTPTASATPYGSGLDQFRTTGAFTWQLRLEPVTDKTMVGLIHGAVPADPINGRLQYLEVQLESDTPTRIYDTSIAWSSHFQSFGIPVSFQVNDRNGIARGYLRLVPYNGLERVIPFTIWFNDPSVSAGYINTDQHFADAANGRAVYVGAQGDGSAADTTSNGSAAAPYATMWYAIQRMTATGGASSRNQDGGKIYLKAGTHVNDTTTGGITANPTYPCVVCPEPGKTWTDVTVTRSSRGAVNLQNDKIILKNLSFDMSMIQSFGGGYVGCCAFRDSSLVDPNPTPNGPVSLGQVVPYYFSTTSQELVASTSGRFTSIIDCALQANALTAFRQYVNVSGPGFTGQAGFTWDVITHEIISATSLGLLWIFNFQPKQITYQRSRNHVETELTVNTATWNGSTTTSVTFSGPATLTAATTDVGFIILDGASAGDQGYTSGSGAGHNSCSSTTLSIADTSGQYATKLQAGYRIRIYTVGHADAFQTSTNQFQTAAGFENMYAQAYHIEGQYIQGQFWQSNNGGAGLTVALPANCFTTSNGLAVVSVAQTAHGITNGAKVAISGASTLNGVTLNGTWTVAVDDANTWHFTAGQTASAGSSGGGASAKIEPCFTSSGTTLTSSFACRLFKYDSIQPKTAAGGVGVQNWGWIGVSDSAATTTHTLEEAFYAGDITDEPSWLGKGQSDVLFVNCIINKTGDGPELFQVQTALRNAGQIGCTYRSKNLVGATAPNNGVQCYDMRVRSAGFALKGWSMYGCVVDSVTLDSSTPAEVFPTAFMKADRNHFVYPTAAYSWSTNSDIGNVVFDGNMLPTSGVGSTCDANIAAAAPFDIYGNARRVGDPVGAVARAS